MGKFLSVLIGLVLLALGVWGVITWSEPVVSFLKAAVVLMAIIVGLGIFVFGLSELRSGAEEPPALDTTPPTASGTSAGSSAPS